MIVNGLDFLMTIICLVKTCVNLYEAMSDCIVLRILTACYALACYCCAVTVSLSRKSKVR